MYVAFKGKTFGEFLTAQGLTPLLIRYVLHSIAMLSSEVPTEEVCRSIYCTHIKLVVDRVWRLRTYSFILWAGLVIHHFCILYMAVVSYHKRFAGKQVMLILLTIPLLVCLRFCAVFGGVYVLRRSIASLLLDENKLVWDIFWMACLYVPVCLCSSVTGIICSAGQRINCKWIGYYSSNVLLIGATRIGL